MVFSKYIRQLLGERIQRDLRHSNDCEYLALDIESVTGEHIGVNTIKRLLGFINDERQPRCSTLDVIAHYLGFENWDILSIYDERSNSTFGLTNDELIASSLSTGQRIQLSYLPDRRILLEFQGEGRFIVLQSQNSKLLAGDEIWVTHFVKGYPLLVSKVRREGSFLGAFTAGKAQGIDFEIV